MDLNADEMTVKVKYKRATWVITNNQNKVYNDFNQSTMYILLTINNLSSIKPDKKHA